MKYNCVRTPPLRYIVGGVLALTSVIRTLVQSDMSITILAMTNPIHNDTEEPAPDYGPRYDWSAYDQSLVMGSFYWGSLVITPFIGVVVERYGTRYICGLAFVAICLVTILTPVSAQILWLTIVLRFIAGFVMGTVYPTFQAIIANWAPPEEKGLFLSAFSFNGLGIIIEWSMAGFIIERFGWHYAYYNLAVILGIFSMIWFFIVYDSPRKHPRILQAEKDYIEGKITKITKITKNTKEWPPFRSIFLNIPFWAWTLLNFGGGYGISSFVTYAPRYLSEVHNFTISTTGLLGSIPTLLRWIGGISFGLLGDFLLRRKLMRVNPIRKWFCLFSHIIPGCLLIALTFFGDRPYICVAFYALAMGISGANTITYLQIPHDMAPNFASSIYGLGGVFALTPGFIAPVIVAYFTQERSTEAEWQPIFFIAAGIYIGSAIVFILFGSANVQKYNHI